MGFVFKQRMTKNTRALVSELDINPEGWTDAGHGFQGKESTLRLSTWTRTRRVIVLRRLSQQRYRRRKDIQNGHQEVLDVALPFVTAQDFEYQVIVTNLTDSIEAIAQLYRERGDAENIFDELKNQWGWGGFTSKKLSACQLSARLTALIYNWWSIFVRLASPEHHREMVTSRPLLLNSIVRQTSSGGQQTLTIASNHVHAGRIADYFAKLSDYLRGFRAKAEHWTSEQCWDALLRKIYASAFGPLVPGAG